VSRPTKPTRDYIPPIEESRKYLPAIDKKSKAKNSNYVGSLPKF
jgi:hypothetical protein